MWAQLLEVRRVHVLFVTAWPQADPSGLARMPTNEPENLDIAKESRARSSHVQTQKFPILVDVSQ